MKFGIVSVLPELIHAGLSEGVIGRAVGRGQIGVQVFDPRDHVTDKHRTVDDRPFGGGPGMVMKPEPLAAAIAAAKIALPLARVAYLSPQGKTFSQSQAVACAAADEWILVAGRYEGIDERIVEHYIDEEISLGDYVMSGGELAALVMIDVIGRLVPGVLGHPDSANEDSFGETGLLDHPHYTRPEVFCGLEVPKVLTSGDHAAIAEWRHRAALERTQAKRPDMLTHAELGGEDKQILADAATQAAASRD